MIPFPELEKIAEPTTRSADPGAAWWWWLAATILGLVVLGVLIGVLTTLGRQAGAPGAPVRVEKLALRELKSLRRRAETLDGPAFGAALSEVVRMFLHRRMGLPARFATTEELLGRSRAADEAPPPPVVTQFAPVLEGCDALKFGGGTAAARESLLEAAEAAIRTVAKAPAPAILTLLPEPAHVAAA